MCRIFITHSINKPVTNIMMQKTVLKVLLTIIATELGFTASAQRIGAFSTTPVVDATGKPVTVDRYMHVFGSPMLFEQWLPGEVVNSSGKLFTGMLLKFDIQNNVLTFVYDRDEEPQRFAEPITAFTIFADRKMSFANGFPKIDGKGRETYYEVIALGKTMLLKHHRQLLKDVRSSNLAMTDGVYVNRYDYYVLKDGKMLGIKPEAKSIQNALNDKTDEVVKYLSTANLNYKNDDDLKKVFDYYNAL